MVDLVAARVKPQLPDGAIALVRMAQSLSSDGPVVGLPSARRALAIAPHPDDETIGPGGTLALLAATGSEVTVVTLTDGESTPGSGSPASSVGRRRRQEAARACAMLGVPPPRPLGFPDGRVGEHVAEIARALRALTDEIEPDLLFIPWFGDGHVDHRAVTVALDRSGVVGPQIWGYEVWTPLPANRLVDVTSVISRKSEAIAEHGTAARSFDVSAMLGLNRYRSAHGLAGEGWAEAFLALPLERYLALASAHMGEWTRSRGHGELE